MHNNCDKSLEGINQNRKKKFFSYEDLFSITSILIDCNEY